MNFDPETLERLPIDVPEFPAFEQWLDEEVDARTFLGATMRVKRWQRLLWLVACNGGSWQVHSWGCIGGGDPFQSGLEQNDAIELMRSEAFIEGASAVVGSSIFDYLFPTFEKFVKDVEAQAKALAEETPPPGGKP